MTVSWVIEYKNELARAETARNQGNEGRARVCARRAVGIVIGEYLHRNGFPVNNTSAYDRIQLLAVQPSLSTEIHTLLEHFLIRVTDEHQLPIDVDLIMDARRLAQVLISR